MEEKNIFKNINTNEANEFLKHTVSEYNEKELEKIRAFDLTWIKKFEETLPFIDNIVRHPRKFIVPEEEITIIEKTKKVNEESIKHLAKNSDLVREIDEDGFVKPSKLLNVYKEETFDLYENRFMNSLIRNLYKFIQIVLNSDSYESYRELKREANYTGETKINGEKIRIRLNIEMDSKENKNVNIKDMEDIITRINYLKEIIYGFMSSDFIKSLSQAVPVKSPIRKTNVFLKDQNFKMALDLWGFLERYEDIKLSSNVENKKEKSEPKKKEDFDFLYYLSYNILNPCNKKELENYEMPVVGNNYVYKFIESYVMEFEGTEKDFKKNVEKQYRIAINKKKKNDKEIIELFAKIARKYNKRKKLALK